MQGITLRSMLESEFEEFRTLSLAGYARDLAQAQGLSAPAARAQAEKQFADFLPQGVHSPNNHLMMVLASDQPVGHFWYQYRIQSDVKTAFVADIYFAPEHRGRGYGTEVLQWFEKTARENGAHRLGLHVFGHNPRARALYEDMGFVTTNVVMAKTL